VDNANIMTKKEQPSPYHHGNLRAALLAAAAEQLAGQNGETLSLRGLAAQAGVSVAAVYRHFPNKNALLAQVAVDGFDDLCGLWERELPGRGEAGAEARFQRLGELYVEFALASPAHFRLMFGQPDLKGFPELRAAADRCFGYVVDAARGTVEEAQAGPEWVLPLANAAWSLVHGYVHLALARLLTKKGGKPDLPPGLLTRFVQLPAEARGPQAGRG
jgi:AcrR family transcriptional regulator